MRPALSGNAVAGTSTLGYIPVWTDSAGTLGNSNLYNSVGGNVGIGTTSPVATLDVGGYLHASGNSNPATTGQGAYLGWNALYGGGVGETDFINNQGGGAGGFAFMSTPLAGSPKTTLMFLNGAGNLGIGTTAPSQKLEVAGNLKLSNGGALVFNDGTTMTSAAVSGVNLTSPDTSITVGGTPSAPTVAVNTVAASKITGQVQYSQLGGGACTTGQILQWSGSAWACAAIPVTLGVGGNSFAGPQTASVSDPNGYAFQGRNLAVSGNADAVRGISSSNSGRGVVGMATTTVTGTNSTATGVYGSSQATNGAGVYGEASATAAGSVNYGVWGLTRSPSGIGVRGEAPSTATNASNNTTGVYGVSAGDNGSSGVFGYASNSTTKTDTYGVYGRSDAAGGIGVYGVASSVSTNGQYPPVGVYGEAVAANGFAGYFLKASTQGDVLEADAFNGAQNQVAVMRLTATGDLHIAGATYPGGADYAEMMDVEGPTKAYAPGDVLVISENADRTVELSSTPYSTKVVGVYSTKPGFVGSPHAMMEKKDSEIPMAMVGIVPCKASAENGSIQRGDLLVTSSIPGHVMKATDRLRTTGAIVGKALQALESGTGTIEIAVTLQ